ncbi:Hypothetical_protein [Hexamita inflata]|uniref:Hypothetical_protein n=1 Tax=Hexamita inflata TaxID=28002 RepID=A0AA86N3X5_9EUKA|nr:Hypothetical protein HINF_LOCUS187 [Hexamita inflata]
MLASHVEKAGRFLEDSWDGFESELKESDHKEFPYLHLPIHSDAFQKTVLQQKQQTKYYRRVLKQEQPLTEKQVKNINQMKTQDEHYKQLIAYIQFDHSSKRQQTQQFIYCLQVHHQLVFDLQITILGAYSQSQARAQSKADNA